MSRRTRWTAAAYVVGFTEGTGSHVYFLAAGGTHAYRGDPLLFQGLFHALLVIDPLVVALVVGRRPAGALLGAVVIAADAFANWWVLAGDVVRHPLRYLTPIGLLPISLFALFVLVTALPLARALAAAQPPAP